MNLRIVILLFLLHTAVFVRTQTEDSTIVTNFTVNPLSSLAQWSKPEICIFFEDFEDETFPPEGWGTSSNGMGWFRSDSASSPNFNIPAWDSFYAATNDELAPSGNDGCCDYLITPPIDLSVFDNYILSFSSYSSSRYYRSSMVEYSIDNGASWDTLRALWHGSSWNHIKLDLSPYQNIIGNDSVLLAFRSDDGIYTATGWVIDNVKISSFNPPDYYLLLMNGTITDTVSGSENEHFYDCLAFGSENTAGISAVYDWGPADTVLYDFVSAFTYPPDDFTANSEFGSDQINLSFKVPKGCDLNIPAGLISFNVYFNGDLVGNIPFEPGTEWINHVFDNLSPDNYEVCISAVYDLSDHGFPGETAESIRACQTVDVAWGHELPFYEDWSSGSFETNGWTTGSLDWSIDVHQGIPVPSLRYSGIEKTYFFSDYINAKNLNEGEFWLEFNLKLETDSVGNWGDILKLAINESNTWWNPVATYRSTNGSFDWDTIRINITEIAKKSIFRLRFETYHYDGNDSTIQWHIDNIHIYRACKPPEDLTLDIDTTDYDQYQLNFSWEMDSILQGKKLHWDNDKNFSGIGAGVNVTGAIRWDPYQLINYDGDTILGMRAFILDNDFEKLVFRIWEGANAGHLIYHDTITDVLTESWVNHFIDTTLIIDGTKEYWVGYTVFNTAAGTFPLGCDNGPAVKYYGDLISSRYEPPMGWDPLSAFGLDYNWNIQLILKKKDDTYRNLSAYNLYEQNNNGNNEIISTIPWGTNSYSMPFEANYITYCYQLTAQWEIETDVCESEPANTVQNPFNNRICITLVHKDENTDCGQFNISIFPNPARDILNMQSEIEIGHITLFNNLGNIVFQKQINNKDSSIEVSQLSPGIYFLQIETEYGIENSKIVVNH